MIPKIAFTHWQGDMSWIRKRGLETFSEQNPGWELRVLETPKDIKLIGMPRAPSGDWTVWRELYEHGGIRIDSDIIHVRPIPDEWLDSDLCAQINSVGNIHQMAIVGVKRGHSLMMYADEYCAAHSSGIACRTKDHKSSCDPSYQSCGVDMLRRLGKASKFDHSNSLRISDEAFCFYHWEWGARQLWSEAGPENDIPECAIGVHWYGGNAHSVIHEYEAHEGGPSWIERLASR